MRTVRQSVFETNSSSAHCVTFVTKSELDGFLSRELVYSFDDGCMVPADAMYSRFIELIDNDIKHRPALESEFRRLTPTKEEFAKWVYGWENLPEEMRVYEPTNPAVTLMRRKLYMTIEEEDFLVCGYCDETHKQRGTEDLYALSMYRDE